MIYIYSDHLDGSLYFTPFELSNEELFCSQCGGFDEFYGEIASAAEIPAFIKDNLKEYYDEEYLSSFEKELNDYFIKEEDE